MKKRRRSLARERYLDKVESVVNKIQICLAIGVIGSAIAVIYNIARSFTLHN